MKTERYCNPAAALSLTNSGSTTGRINYTAGGLGGFIVTALATGTKIVWNVAMSDTGTAYPLYSGGSAVETAISPGRAYEVPAAAAGFPYVVPVLDAGTATILPVAKS